MKIRKWVALLLALLLALCQAGIAEDSIWEDSGTATVDDTFNQEVAVDQMYNVNEFAVTEGLPDSWVNILLLGTDVRDANKYGRTDSMVILSMNMGTREAKLTTIIRDIWVTMDDRSRSGKLNTACTMGGPMLTVRTINECFGLNIQYYALANLSGLAEIIDLLGGLDLDVTDAERQALNQGLFDLSPYSGMEPLMEYGSDVHMNGNQAVAYGRVRNTDSDFKRTERQRVLLLRLARRLQKENAGTIVGVVMKLLDCVETNMNLTQLMTIAAVGLETDLYHIPQFSVPAEGTYESGTYRLNNSRIWCIRPDFTENTRRLHEFIYGE